MLRKPFAALSLIFIGLIFLLLLTSSGLAAPAAQEENPGERLRPDQYSYHGVEDMPLKSSPRLPEVQDVPINSPVQGWSKMAFESYVDGAGWEIYYASGSFTNLIRLTNNNKSDIHPRLNRGCTRIAFASFRDGTDYEIYTMNTDGSGLVRLTNNNLDDVKPVWSPDGTKIAFQSYRDGQAEVYVMNGDGSGQTRLTYSAVYSGEPTWSPDGSHIAFTSYRNSLWRIWVMDANGANQYQLSQQAYSELPVWSPDGTKIGYDADSNDDGWQEIWLMNSDGSLQKLLTNPEYHSTLWANGWSPDGVWLLYTDVYMVYIDPYWYWDYATLYQVDQDGWTYVINGFRGVDWNLDWTTSDNQPPSSNMSALPPSVPYQFTVSWSGSDAVSEWRNNDVQVRDGLGGVWTNWQMGTTATSAVYTGVGGHIYYFRTRARDNAFNLQAWPANYHAYTRVESMPPITHLNQLKPYTRGTQVTLGWEGADPGGSGISTYDVQVMDDSVGVWQDFLTEFTGTTNEFTGELGHTYHFRLRGTDNALNVEAWSPGDGDATTTMFSWLNAGTARDNTGVPVSGMDVTITPTPLQANPSDVNGNYSAYLESNPDLKTITWSKAEYGPLPATDYGFPDAIVDVCLPPADNLVQDFGFESGLLPGQWQVGGNFTPSLTDTTYHSGDYAASLGVSQSMSAPIMFDSIYLHGWSMTSDRWGNIHMTWIKYGDMTYTVSYAVQAPDGTWSATEQVAQFPASSTGGTQMAVDANGNVHLLILVYPNAFYTMRDNGGNWLDPASIMTTESAGVFIGMEIDDASTIRTVISTADHLYYAEHVDGGAWEIETVPNVIHKNDTALAIAMNGEIYLAWTSYNEEVYFTLRQTDGSWTDPVIFSRPGNARSIDMVVDSNGKPYIVWDTIFPQGLYYTSMNPDGSWIYPHDISAGMGGFEIRLLIDQQDTVYGLWADNYVSDEIVFAQIDPNGEWSAPENISHTSTPSGFVEAAASANGDIYAVWWDIDSAYLIHYAFRHGGIWSTPIRLGNQSSDTYFAKVIVDPMGGGHISWRDGSPFALYYAGTLPNSQSRESDISQSLTLPASMTNPTLSFLASLSGVSEISGDEFSVLVGTDVSTTTLFTSTTPTAWEHHWFDMTPWSGQAITLTFKLSENAGFPPASVLLDEVTLGAAHTDVWVELSEGAGYAQPGEQFTFQLDYGNRSGISALTNMITMTLPTGLNFISASESPEIIGNQLVWHRTELPPDSSSAPIFITVEVDQSAPLLQTVVTSAALTTTSPELEVLNNASQIETFLAYPMYLPVTQR